MAIEMILKRNPLSVFATFTFAENVTEKEEASKRWRRLDARIQRKWEGIVGAGCWQRQERGAWHLHMVISRPVPISDLREMAVACGFGTFVNLRLIGEHKGHRPGWSRSRVISYISRYVTRASGEDKGVRVVQYMGSARVSTTAFGWVTGVARCYRKGRGVWADMFRDGVVDDENPRWDRYWELVELGWHAMTEKEQWWVIQESTLMATRYAPEFCPF